MKTTALLATVLITAACAANPSPVPMVGPSRDLSALAGEWNGEYRSDETGRSGVITFKLQAGADTAFGDVLMIPRETMPAMPEPQAMPDTRRAIPQVLIIRFVRVRAGEISGTINPYRSPDCGCLLSTVFRGQMRGDRIDGTFLIRHSENDMPPQRGTWWASRTRHVVAP